MSKAMKEYYKEQWNREKSDLYISELEEQNEELIEALVWFCKRVDADEEITKRTYETFQELLSKYKGD